MVSIFRLQKVQGLFFFVIHEQEGGTRDGQDKGQDKTRKGLIFEQITTCTPHTGEGRQGDREERERGEKRVSFMQIFFFPMDMAWKVLGGNRDGLADDDVDDEEAQVRRKKGEKDD